MELDERDPALRQLQASRLSAAEANSAQAVKRAFATFWHSANEMFEVVIPSHDYCRNTVAPSGNYRIWRTAGEQIPDKADFVSPRGKKPSYRIGNVFIDEQKHLRTSVRHALRSLALPLLFKLDSGNDILSR